jgi:hypothetical protein
MCAIDALGIAPMFDTPIEISSHDPLNDQEFHGQISPDGAGNWEPESAVVVCGRKQSSGGLLLRLSRAQLLR